MNKILLVDDHKIIRDGICSAIKAEDDFEVIGEASNGNEAIALTKQLTPDIIVMDINMPGMDGVEATQEIRKFDKNVKILMLTMMEDEHYILDALSSEINGYIFKMTGLEDFIYALKIISEGESYFDSKVTKTLMNSRQKHPGKNSNLTAREIEILKLISVGLTSKEIGRKYFISSHTVQKHRKNIIKKLDLHSTAELVKYSIENGLI